MECIPVSEERPLEWKWDPDMDTLPAEAAAWVSKAPTEHMARWEAEIHEGLRDASGRWIAPATQRCRFAPKPKESGESMVTPRNLKSRLGCKSAVRSDK
jgi:hypothetical protein